MTEFFPSPSSRPFFDLRRKSQPFSVLAPRSSLQRVANLRAVGLHQNAFTGLVPSMAKPTIAVLTLHDNLLTAMPGTPFVMSRELHEGSKAEFYSKTTPERVPQETTPPFPTP